MENERHLAIGILRRYVGQNPSVFDENLIDEQGSHGQATGQSHYARGLKENKDLRIDREENFHQISIIYQHLWDLSQGITVKFKSNQTNEISTHLLLIQKQVNEIYQWSQSLPQALPSSLPASLPATSLPSSLLPSTSELDVPSSIQAAALTSALHNLMGDSWEFRGNQLKMIFNSISSHDLLMISPAGSGKTLIGHLQAFLEPQKTLIYFVPLKSLLIDLQSRTPSQISTQIYCNEEFTPANSPQILFVSVEDYDQHLKECLASLVMMEKNLKGDTR